MYAHDRAHRPLVHVGHPSPHQPPRTPTGADPLGGHPPLAARARHIDVPAQPNHVFEAQLRRQRVEQLAVGKAPVRHDSDFHPVRQHFAQPAQHLVLITPLIVLQGRRRHRLPQQGRCAPVPGQHRQHDRLLLVGRKTRPIQRDDHFGAGADEVRRPVGEEGPDVDASIAQEPVYLLDAMLGQRTHGLRQAAPHCMDCQRRTREHAQGGVGQRQHPLGMQVACVQGVDEVQEVLSPKQSPGWCLRFSLWMHRDHILIQARYSANLQDCRKFYLDRTCFLFSGHSKMRGSLRVRPGCTQGR